MVDAHALGTCGLGRAGSNPAFPTHRSRADHCHLVYFGLNVKRLRFSLYTLLNQR